MIEIRDIRKAFGSEQVLKGIDLGLGTQRTLSVLGRSGCGKTTLLKILAGIVDADEGSFRVRGQEMLELRPRERGVVYLSQEPLLFPHLNVFENVAFGLRIRNVKKAEANGQVEQMLAAIGLAKMGRKMPDELSGGQRQRVAFGRAIIIAPKVLLLDEPFGSLDVETRGEMQQLFMRLREDFRITSIFVTHDLKEALIMGDEIGRMAAGELIVYPDRQKFLDDPASGVAAEQQFWNGITLSNEK